MAIKGLAPWNDLRDDHSLILEELIFGKRYMDQPGWHKSKTLQVPKNIRFLLLPPYSPELNPVEKLWQWLKRHICRNRLFSSEDDLMNAVAQELSGLETHILKEICHGSYLFH